MEFAVIAPTSLLSTYAAGRAVQFCLAQYCNRPDYFTFYRSEVERGTTVILDNGAYEGELMDFRELSRIAHELQPTVLVLPDVIGNAKMTTYLHNAFREYWKPASAENWPRLMAVLQGGDIWELIEQYTKVPELWIGFPRCMEETTGARRPQLVEKLKQIGLWQSSTKHHALGMLEGSLSELTQLAKAGFHSCDSSNPVWRGISIQLPFDIDWKGNFSRSNIYDRLNPINDICKGEK